MDTKKLKRLSKCLWQIEKTGKMRVPGLIFADESLIRQMDEKVCTQITNVAALPGIQNASYAMPDAHWGYGFCIGGVAAFDPEKNGVISAGGVGFDIACGVRTLHTGLVYDDIKPHLHKIADALFQNIPAGVGSTGKLRLGASQMDDMLAGGAKWAVDQGYGTADDLHYTEEEGCITRADPAEVSDQAKKRQTDQVGTLGSGNHYLEVQRVTEIYDPKIAEAFNIHLDDIKISIHCGSRGLGHQIGTDFLKKMAASATHYGLDVPDRELACAPVKSALGKSYLGAMSCGINCAVANRQVLTHLVRRTLSNVLSKAEIKLLYDVSHNTCKIEQHAIGPVRKTLFVHRKGATRSLGPASASLIPEYRPFGQPVLIGGTMATASYILAGTSQTENLALSSSCHGAGRQMSRHQAKKKYLGRQILNDLKAQGILIKSRSMRGVAEEAPGAYKDVSAVVEAAHEAGLSKKVAKLKPVICIKG